MSVDKQVTENGIARYKEDRLLRRAIKEDWPLTAEQRKRILDRQIDIATDPNQGSRDASRAAAILVNCRKNDNDKLLKVLDKVSPDQHELTGSIEHDHRVTAEELLKSPEYVEWLRQCERNSDARIVCTNGHKGNGKPVDDGFSRNGH